MRFAQNFLSTLHISLSKLNFNRPIVTTHCHCVQTGVYCLTEVTEVARLISKCTLIDRMPEQQLPTLSLICLRQSIKQKAGLNK